MIFFNSYGTGGHRGCWCSASNGDQNCRSDGENPHSPESGNSLSEFTGSSGSSMSKPMTPIMSPIIHPINDLYTTGSKENIALINSNKSNKQGPKGSKFIAPYKDRENRQKGVAKSKGKDWSKISKIECRAVKDSLYFRKIMRKKKMPTQKELLTKVTQQPIPCKAHIKKGTTDVHLAAKATTKAMAKAKAAAKVGKGKLKRGKQYWLGIVALRKIRMYQKSMELLC